MKKILVIAAHPDDEIYGMGGTVARLTDEGNEVHLLIVTDGSSSQYRNSSELNKIIENKKNETKRAADFVGFETITYGQLPDMKLDATPHILINEVIEKALSHIKPDVVFTHFWGDVNLDHQRVYESTLVATRPTNTQSVKEVYCYNVPSSTEWNPRNGFEPNYFIDISEYSEQKIKAILAYKTEIRDFPHPRSVEYVSQQDQLTGLQIGKKSCESFVLIRKYI